MDNKTDIGRQPFNNSELGLDWLFKMVLDYNERKNPNEPDTIDLEKIPDYFERLRFSYENYLSGNWLALLDCVQICRDERLPLPDWAAAGISTFVIETVLGTSHGGKGRANSPAARVRESLKREKRYETVRRLRLAQDFQDSDSGLIHFLAMPEETKRLINSGKIQNIGTTLEDALAVAELSLRGTFAQASSKTIERAYRNYVEDEFMVSHETKVALGLANNDFESSLKDFHFVPLDQLAKDKASPDEK